MSPKKHGPAGASTAAVAALQQAGVPFQQHAYHHAQQETAFGAEAARELGRDPLQVCKTLMLHHDGDYAVVVVPVATSVDLKAAAAALGWKQAALAEPRTAERRSGYVVGGISPLGQKTPVTVLVEEFVQAFETVLVSGGKRGLDLELSPQDLVSVTGGRFAPVATG